MNTLSYKTVSANKSTVVKKWYVIDAEGEIVGRLASEIARVLRGKHKADFTPHVDCGDNVIVLNADKIRLTGKKMSAKEYVFYSGYPSGRRTVIAKDILRKRPIYALEHAIKGMLPKNKLGAELFRNLFVYADKTHPHEAQQPAVWEVGKFERVVINSIGSKKDLLAAAKIGAKSLKPATPAAKSPAPKASVKKVETSDDLKRLNGVGPAFERKLNELGVITFADMAALTDAKIETLEQTYNLTSMEEWHKWQDQSREFMNQ